MVCLGNEIPVNVQWSVYVHFYSQFYSTEPPKKVKPVDLSWWWWWFHTLPQFLPSAISSNCMIRVFCRQFFSKARSGCFVCMWKPLEFNLFYMILLIQLDILKNLFLIMLWKWFIHNTHVHGILNVSSGWLSVKISSFWKLRLPFE